MRILITTINATSHLRALSPVAVAAVAAGHDVLVAGPAGMGDEVRGDYGLDFRPVGVDWTAGGDNAETIGRHLAVGAHRAYTDTLKERVFFGEPALRAAEDIRDIAATWRADVIVRVAEEFGGYLAAEALGIPQIAIASGCTHLLRTADIQPELARLHAGFGLPGTGTLDPYRHLLASFTPPGYTADLATPALRHYRHTQPSRLGERVPDWLADLPADKPLVFAAFGSVISGQSWKLAPIANALVSALGDVDCTAVVAAGDTAKELAERAPGNVRVVDTVAQPLIVEAADVFVTHAGFGSVREALRAATPMVAVPIIGDEPYHAARCADLGLAKVVPPTASARVLARACTEVLETPSYRASARRVARTMLALPGVEELVEDIRVIAEGTR
jgi:N-glycosyltransferase